MALSKWEQKQAAAKAAEAKFAENMARQGKGKGKGSSSGDTETKRKPRNFNGLIAVVVVLLAAGGIYGSCRYMKHRLKVIPGWPKSEVFIAGSPGTLIVMDHVEVGGVDEQGTKTGPATSTGERLTAIDADTGKELAVEVSEYKECWAGGPRLVCVDIYDRVDFLEPRTLERVVSANDVIADANVAKPTRKFHRTAEGVIVELEDGRGARINADTLGLKLLETVEWRLPKIESERCPTDWFLEVGKTELFFDQDGTRKTLKSKPPPPAESATPGSGALTFLDGAFLRLAEPLPLILHRVVSNKRDGIVSRVEGATKEKWKTPLGGECRRAWIYGPLLVVATGNPEQRGVAIDLASGRIAWTFGR